MRIFFLWVYFLCFLLPISVTAQEGNPLEKIKEFSSTTQQLEILGEAINKNQMAQPALLYAFARAYDSIAKIDQSQEAKINAINFNGNAHYANEDYDKAIEYYIEAISLLEQKEISMKLSQIYNNLAGCYRVSNDFTNTEKYFRKALEIGVALGNKKWVANINNNLAVVYMDNHLFKEADAKYQAALDIYAQTNDTLMMGITYMNQGNSRISSKAYPQAIDRYVKAQEYVPYEMVPLLHAVSQTGIGIALTKQGKFNKAKPFLDKGTEIAKSINHSEQLMESYSALSDYYSKTEDYKNAFELSAVSQQLRDSIKTNEQNKNLSDALAKYEGEKKDLQLQTLAFEKEKETRHKERFIFLSLAAILLASFIGFFFVKNRSKNKLLASQKQTLETTLGQKDVLLKEIHHRVKNNLQVISSLLSLQQRQLNDPKASQAIQVGRDRVKAMSLIHQNLYQDTNLIGVEADEYIDNLAHSLVNTYKTEDKEIRIKTDVSAIKLDIDTIIPLGLIINELISNSLKYAFKNQASGEIAISLNEDGQSLHLRVMDNGVGLPEDFSVENNTSLGYRLIKAFSDKLKGTLQVDSKKGNTSISIAIKDYKLA